MSRAWLVWEEAAEDGRFRQYADLKEDERAARSLAMSLLASFGAGWDRAFSIRFDPPPLSPDKTMILQLGGTEEGFTHRLRFRPISEEVGLEITDGNLEYRLRVLEVEVLELEEIAEEEEA